MTVVRAVISVGETLTRGRDPTQPLTGGAMSIFAPTVLKAETVIDCVGVYTTAEAATRAAEQFVAGHPQHRVKIRVVTLDDLERAGEAKPEQTMAVCMNCGRPAQGGGFCQSCQQAHWAACRESDPELLEQLEAAAK
jgi:hypothetical protein